MLRKHLSSTVDTSSGSSKLLDNVNLVLRWMLSGVTMDFWHWLMVQMTSDHHKQLKLDRKRRFKMINAWHQLGLYRYLRYATWSGGDSMHESFCSSVSLLVSVPLSFFSSSIHVTNDKVQHSCPYIDLCSVWSVWDWEDGAHAQTQRVRLHRVLRHLGALGNVNMFKALYLKCLTWKCCHNLWPRCSINSLCRNVKRRVWFLLLSYIWRRAQNVFFFF